MLRDTAKACGNLRDTMEARGNLQDTAEARNVGCTGVGRQAKRYILPVPLDTSWDLKLWLVHSPCFVFALHYTILLIEMDCGISIRIWPSKRKGDISQQYGKQKTINYQQLLRKSHISTDKVLDCLFSTFLRFKIGFNWATWCVVHYFCLSSFYKVMGNFVIFSLVG